TRRSSDLTGVHRLRTSLERTLPCTPLFDISVCPASSSPPPPTHRRPIWHCWPAARRHSATQSGRWRPLRPSRSLLSVSCWVGLRSALARQSPPASLTRQLMGHEH